MGFTIAASRPSAHMLSSTVDFVLDFVESENMPAASDLVEDADDMLFDRLMREKTSCSVPSFT